MVLLRTFTLVKQAALEWMGDNAPRLGAALAFYSALSIAPLLVIALAIAGAVFGPDAARGAVVSQFEELVGTEGARAIQEMIVHAQQPTLGTVAAVLGLITLLFGAAGVFGELQAALNIIWKVKPPQGHGWWRMVKDRFFSFMLVLGTGFLLLVSLIISAALHALEQYLTGLAPAVIAGQFANALVSFVVVTLLFALIFKFVPDTHVAWRDAWVGAAFTAVLFGVGKSLLGLYLGRSTIGSAYGAAGSLVVLLVWIYYSAQILFFGAEVTQVQARRHSPAARANLPAEIKHSQSVGPNRFVPQHH